MKIGEVARLSGVSKDAVRLYTRYGLIQCTYENAGSAQYAVYDEEAVEMIKGIKTMQSLGFKLSEMKPLAEAYQAGTLNTATGRAALRAKLEEIKTKQTHLAELAAQIQHKLSSPHPATASHRER